MKSLGAHLVVASAAFMFFNSGARAQSIANGNFQLDAAEFDHSGSFGAVSVGGNPVAIPDWIFGSTPGANPGSGTTVGLGGADPGTNAFGPSNAASAPSADADYAWIYHSGYIMQDITFRPDTTYILTLDVAIRAGDTAVPYYVIDDGNSTTPTPAQGVSNFATAPNSSGWTAESIAFTTTTGGPGYVLFGNDPVSLPQGQDQTIDFANFYLDPPSVPEPRAWTLLLLGCALFAAARRPRRA